jgi:DNA (cytosine-5)-methyltransferase 1
MPKFKHLDLFSGVGGFSLAASWVWGKDHEVVCFCEMDPFCKKILNKHWPGVPIVEDVNDVGRILEIAQQQRLEEPGSLGADLSVRSGEAEPSEEREEKEGDDGTGILAYTESKRGLSRGRNGGSIYRSGFLSTDNQEEQERRTHKKENIDIRHNADNGCNCERKISSTPTRPTPTNVDLLTGGFPCQGFSVAGKQRGKEDDRYLWPAMYEAVKATRPRWVIGENVAGIIKLALDTVLSDLEAEGYTTRTFIIPACAQNAPHRRDRIWIVGYSSSTGRKTRNRIASRNEKRSKEFENSSTQPSDVADTGNQRSQGNEQLRTHEQGEGASLPTAECCEDESPDVADTQGTEFKGERPTPRGRRPEPGCSRRRKFERRLGRVTDGLPHRVDNPWGPGWEDGTPRVITGQKDRVNRLKALGNSIVPQVVYEIMMSIKEVDNGQT